MLQLTQNLKDARSKPILRPNIILEIDGLTDKFCVNPVIGYIRVGDEGLFIGDDWVIGGKGTRSDILSYITLDGSTTSIGQQLNQDKGGASSVSSIQISLIDNKNEITQLVSPWFTLQEIMGRRAWVYIGFDDVNSQTLFPEDYPTLFSGIRDELTSVSTITLSVSHPEQKKRQDIYPSIETELNGSINNSVTTITLETVENLLLPYSTVLETYVVIDDEIIRYTGINTGTN